MEIQTNLSLNNSVAFAGFWIRLHAYMIDVVVLLLPSWLLLHLLHTILSPTSPAEKNSFDAINAAAQIIFGWMYFAICHSSLWQASVGKKVFSLKVIDKAGNRISFNRASIRSFSTVLSLFSMLFGYIMIGWTEKKQGLHDMIAGTYVIQKNKPNQ